MVLEPGPFFTAPARGQQAALASDTSLVPGQDMGPWVGPTQRGHGQTGQGCGELEISSAMVLLGQGLMA